jgi:hypothetical protein
MQTWQYISLQVMVIVIEVTIEMKIHKQSI